MYFKIVFLLVIRGILAEKVNLYHLEKSDTNLIKCSFHYEIIPRNLIILKNILSSSSSFNEKHGY